MYNTYLQNFYEQTMWIYNKYIYFMDVVDDAKLYLQLS